MNGKPGDHPVRDVCDYGLEIYGAEADGLIRKIAGLSNYEELYEWWESEIGWHANRDEARIQAQTRYQTLLQRVRERGWETDQYE